MLSLGTRQSFGLFLTPMSFDLGWGRETFAFAIALQNLIWGMAQPFAGLVADKFGATRVVVAGGLLYAIGLVCMALANTGLTLDLSAGLLIGLGLSGTSFGVVMGVVGRMVSIAKRSLALGVVGAGGSFGQFIMLPYGQTLITNFGWQWSLFVLAVTAALIMPLATVLAGKPAGDSIIQDNQTAAEAVRQAASHKGFWYLTFSFLVCGFQTVFIMIHLPAFLMDNGMGPLTGMTALALIGLFNILGSYLCGLLGGRYSKKYLLSSIYLLRAGVIALLVVVPVTPVTVYLFAAVMGLTWLGTVPLTNGLVAQIFGVKYLATLFSIAFLGHQIGSFLGAWYGGYMFDVAGSYLNVWMVAIGLSIVAALLCRPIDERRIGTLAVQEKTV